MPSNSKISEALILVTLFNGSAIIESNARPIDSYAKHRFLVVVVTKFLKH